MVQFRWSVAAALLYSSTIVLAHGQDESAAAVKEGMKMAGGHSTMPADLPDWYTMDSYSTLSAHSGSMVAHIILMTVAWVLVLPIGVVLSISKSRYTVPVQFVFLIFNGLGVIFGTIYNVSTPDLYENNAHHKVGWFTTWVVTAQVVMSLLFLYSGRTDEKSPPSVEQSAFIPVSTADMDQHDMIAYHDYRWSGDSGQGTERSSLHGSRDISPTDAHRFTKLEPRPDDDDDEDEEGLPRPMPADQRPSRFRIRAVDKFLSRRVPGLLSAKLLKAVETVYEVVDRTVLVLGFVALTSGGVVYAGIFRGDNVFNGLAHFVKGGIFFWYGLLTLGRWMGCFADMRWAWNRSEVGQWKASVPSAEFIESFVIFLYGSVDVFLEHLAAWGHPWAAQDLEHVSIPVMFLGGGLCGMLVESKSIRNLLNTSVESMPIRNDVHPAEAKLLRQEPRIYAHSLNPMPALVIFLLGLLMSSHHQDSMVSTTLHKQWGLLFVGFALARAVTYIMIWISPPSSIWPSRPPSELVSAFCLISGGFVFMASNKDTVFCIEQRGLMAMFIFTLMMGLTGLIMAYEIIVLALKGWAVQREQKLAQK